MNQEIFKKFSQQMKTVAGRASGVVATDRSYFGHVAIVVFVIAVAIVIGVGQQEPGPSVLTVTAQLSEAEKILGGDPVEAQSAHGASRAGGDRQDVVIEPAVKSVVDEKAIADPRVQQDSSPMAQNDSSSDGQLNVNPAAAVVRDLDAPEAVFSHAVTASWPLASLTKVMTAVVALEELGPGAPVIISETAVATEGVAGNFSPGEEYLVSDLVLAMMTVSSNDAAAALKEAYDRNRARTLDGSLENSTISPFILAMRSKASVLGMSDTFFNDASGLSAVNQSTVADVEKLVRYVLAKQPDIFRYSTKREATIVNQITGAKRNLRNINQFAGRSDFVGGKTGYTDYAGENLISLFEYEGKTYLVVVFGSRDRFNETMKLYSWAKAQE